MINVYEISDMTEYEFLADISNTADKDARQRIDMRMAILEAKGLNVMRFIKIV